MKMLRPLLVISLLFPLLFACGEKGKPAEARTGQIRDSLPRISEEMAVNSYADIDRSPMDMSYFPVDYPKLKMTDENLPPPVVRVIYSRPHLQGRELFHDVLKYGQRWRLGANEATELDVYRDIIIQGRKIKPGRYVLYCVLNPDKWTMVFNSNIDSWGLKQDTTKDVARFDIPVTHGNPPLEYFTMVFEKSDDGAALVMAWDDVLARLPFRY